MGKLEHFDVIFRESRNNVFFSGQEVIGVVRLRLSTQMRVREIRVNIQGAAGTRWTEPNGKYTDVYSSSQTYINEMIKVWPHPDQTNPKLEYMEPANYELPFAFNLPLHCPSTFEGIYGSIRYFCKVVIDRPWKFDEQFKLPFTVICVTDLNREPDAIRPLQDTVSKQIGLSSCFQSSSGKVECSVNIDRSGYVPGESIPMNFIVSNNSSKSIELIAAKIIENVVFKGACLFSTHTRSSNRIVAQLTCNEVVEPERSQIWTGISLPIPPICPMIRTCSLISLTYSLTIEVHTKSLLFDSPLQMFFPLLIGTMPLTTTVHQNMSQSLQGRQINSEYPSAPPERMDYPDLSPPAYEEAVFGGGMIRDETDDEHTTCPDSYIPRYPYYTSLNDKSKTTVDSLFKEGHGPC